VRIVLHDYSGHPFQVQLGRNLAARGHEVLHLHCASYTTGKGAVSPRDDDPDTFSVEAVALDEPIAKYSARKRPFQEREYGRRLSRRVAAFAPDAVISSNNPLLSQHAFQRECRRLHIPFVFWQQDIYSFPMKQAIEERLPLGGALVGDSFVALERRLLKRSDAVIAISEDFVPVLLRWEIPLSKIEVIENWAPLDELPVLPRDNEWARAHGLAGRTVALYSGTLGLKHDPGLLLELARRFRGRRDVRVVVISEGLGADWLHEQAREHALENLVVLPFQPYEKLPSVLASGDVLLAILEREAAVFSVPSKVLSYHCAGRAVLAAVPAQNLAARVIASARSGIVVDPGDPGAFAAGAETLLEDAELRSDLGRNARRYAEATFDIEMIGDRFEGVLQRAVGRLGASTTMAVEAK
jgi:colanic acid biosynthesis glycosyl transferase WcaI